MKSPEVATIICPFLNRVLMYQMGKVLKIYAKSYCWKLCLEAQS